MICKFKTLLAINDAEFSFKELFGNLKNEYQGDFVVSHLQESNSIEITKQKKSTTHYGKDNQHRLHLLDELQISLNHDKSSLIIHFNLMNLVIVGLLFFIIINLMGYFMYNASLEALVIINIVPLLIILISFLISYDKHMRIIEKCIGENSNKYINS